MLFLRDTPPHADHDCPPGTRRWELELEDPTRHVGKIRRLENVLDSIRLFFVETLNKEAKIAKRDAEAATKVIIKGLSSFTFS